MLRCSETGGVSALDSRHERDYIDIQGREDAMTNIFHGFESDIALQATLLVLGCATFFGVLWCSRCPDCNWLEWISGRDQD